jgi:hypothetical protein
MTRHISRSNVIFVTFCLLPFSVSLAEIDGKQVIDGLGVTAAEVAKMEGGAILTFSDEAYESTKRELSADAMILVDTDLDAIVRSITEEATLVPANSVIDFGIVKSEADFAAVSFTEAEYGEVKDLFSAKPGKNLNFSDSEYQLLQDRLAPHKKSTRAEQIVAASDAMREILIGRYKHYLENGLSGIEGYTRSRKKTIDIGREIRLTTETFKPFEGDFPEFYKVMHDFPAGAECCDHYFRWLKVKIRKRPVFALVHTMIQTTDDFVLATERYYFVTSTLNSLQVTVSWLKYDENTYMGMAMSASTDLLDSMMGRVLRPIGRNKAKDMVEEIMLSVKSDLESGEMAESAN